MFFLNLWGHNSYSQDMISINKSVLAYLLLFSIIVLTTPVSCSTLSCFLYRIDLFLLYIQLFLVQNIFISAVHLAVSCTEQIYFCSTLSCFLYKIYSFLPYTQLFPVQNKFISAVHLAVSCTEYFYFCCTLSCFLHRI